MELRYEKVYEHLDRAAEALPDRFEEIQGIKRTLTELDRKIMTSPIGREPVTALEALSRLYTLAYQMEEPNLRRAVEEYLKSSYDSIKKTAEEVLSSYLDAAGSRAVELIRQSLPEDIREEFDAINRGMTRATRRERTAIDRNLKELLGRLRSEVGEPAYEEMGTLTRALREYSVAAEDYLRSGDPEALKRMSDSIRTLATVLRSMGDSGVDASSFADLLLRSMHG